MFQRIQNRFLKSRPGSVLILVVVLVVLLALMGTAVLTTTRADRYTSVQHTSNTQIDMLVEGVKEMAKAAIVGDLYTTQNGQRVFRAPYESASDHVDTVPTDLINEQWDMPLMIDPPVMVAAATAIGSSKAEFQQLTNLRDIWLSPRVPIGYECYTGGAFQFDGNAIAWPCIGRLPNVGTFDSPISCPPLAPHQVDMANPMQSTYAAHTPIWMGPDLPPIWVPLIPDHIDNIPGGSLPAWWFPAGTPGGARYEVAGDADGDGIADSGLFKLPVGEIDGLTYYAAVRIIDNNSAVNINTAFSNQFDMGIDSTSGNAGQKTDALGTPLVTNGSPGPPWGAGSLPWAGNLGIFRSHVGLRELIHNPLNNIDDEIKPVIEYRLHGNAAASSSPMDDSSNDLSITFKFRTLGDALEHQLARRIDNPGRYDASNLYSTFSTTDSAALAYHFTLLNPTVPPSQLESTLNGIIPPLTAPDTLYRGAPNYDFGAGTVSAMYGQRAYQPSQTAKWFDDNFNYTGITDNLQWGSGTVTTTDSVNRSTNEPNYWRPVRALLTASSTTSNLIPLKDLGNVPDQYKTTTPFASLANADLMPNYVTGNGPGNPKYPAKANVNIASFGELWRAYWCVMAENLGGLGSPFNVSDNPQPAAVGGLYAGMKFDNTPGSPMLPPAAPDGVDPQHMFRSVIRDPSIVGAPACFSAKSMVLLRSAAAAVQTLQLRDSKLYDPTIAPVSRTIHNVLLKNPAGTATNVDVKLWGAKPQPFITEVFVWTDTKSTDQFDAGAFPNSRAYIAIELHNPYPVDITLDTTFQIRSLDRPTTAMVYPIDPTTQMTTIYTFDTPLTIPAGSYAILDNGQQQPKSAKTRGNYSGLPPAQIRTITSPHDLADVLGHELIIVQQFGTADETDTMRPIDSFDFSGITAASPAQAQAFHYARPCGGDQRWLCVYPGRYYVDPSGSAIPRHQGTDRTAIWDPTNAGTDPWGTGGGGEQVVDPTLGMDNPSGTLPSVLPIPLCGSDIKAMAGPYAPTGPTNNRFPFGGFARNGDILQVPFIAAWTILPVGSTNQLVELNSISMDAAFAEDSDASDDFPGAPGGTPPNSPGNPPTDQPFPREQVGRFCPLLIYQAPAFPVLPSPAPLIDDFNSGANLTGDNPLSRYAWAKKLFDYLTVQSPSSDYLPNLPALPDGTVNTLVSPAPTAVKNVNGTAADPLGTGPGGTKTSGEETVPIHGLININTAPWKVLAAIPWTPAGQHKYLFLPPDARNGGGGAAVFIPNSGSVVDGLDDNGEIAKAIVYWRDGDPTHRNNSRVAFVPTTFSRGPFKTIYDLYRVRIPADPGEDTLTGGVAAPYNPYIFQRIQQDLMDANGNGKLDPNEDPGNAQGDFSPLDVSGTPVPDHSRYDFEEQYLMLTKVSNLITTRSDSFTVYVQVQGWNHVGDPKFTPKLVVQRRAAFIMDRSGITPTNSNGGVTVNVPND